MVEDEKNLQQPQHRQIDDDLGLAGNHVSLTMMSQLMRLVMTMAKA